MPYLSIDWRITVGWISKNRDALSPAIQSLLSTSKNDIIAQIFAAVTNETGQQSKKMQLSPFYKV